ncbi:MAG: ABC transporter permease [Armatimonadetes bacterium]|nr:ABC transporter permease [Armatimonadota bacterium]
MNRDPAIERSRLRWGRLDAGGVAGLLLTLLVVGAAIFAPYLMAHDPTLQDLEVRLLPPAWAGGRWDYPLGTDPLGRDLYSRIVLGARASLVVGLLSVGAAVMVGVPLGLITGFYRGRLDRVVMRIADIQLAFPEVLLALAILAVLGPSNVNLVIVLALSRWVVFARVVRGETLAVRERDYVLAASAMGAGDLRTIARHVVPNILNGVIILASVTLTRVIIAESSLSFLGFGIQPPTPTWGGMISDGRGYLATAWWVSTLPGFALMLAVMGINLLGDAVRDLLDPRLRV